MNVQPNIPNAKTSLSSLSSLGARPVHFGAGVTPPEMQGVTGLVERGFQKLMPDRTMQMLVEDFLGFGLLRTGMDLWRGKEYGNDQMNLPAAGERLGRESASIFTDNILAGIVAWTMGKFIFDKTSGHKAAAFNNKFVDYPTLEAFKAAAGKLNPQEGKDAFLGHLLDSHFRDAGHRAAAEGFFNKAWQEGAVFSPATDKAQKTAQQKALSTKLEAWATDFSNKLTVKQAKTGADSSNLVNGFTYTRAASPGSPERAFNLKSLLEDVHGFSSHMSQLMRSESGKTWKTLAEESIQRTIKAKNVTIPVGLGVAMLATFAVPFAISGISRKFGIDYYPGEIGLRQEDDKNPTNAHKGFWERHAPYLTESLKKGNYGPLLMTLAPLPLAAGLWNTTKLNKLGLPVLVKSLKEWKHLFDYQKLKPFTAQQQMASLFALLITARLLNSRSDNEYRERVLDSFVGWGAWIMGTPLLNKLAASRLDKWTGTMLAKPNGAGLRSRAEIEALRKLEDVSSEVVTKTLKSHTWMNLATTSTTMFGLGLVIPWLGIKLTQNNETRKRQAREAQAAQKAPVRPAPLPPLPNPLGYLPQASPFMAAPTLGQRPGALGSPR